MQRLGDKMEKRNLKCYIKNIAISINNVYNLECNLNEKENVLSYVEDNISVILQYKKDIKITRETKEYKIQMSFKLNEETEGIYVLKENNSCLSLKVFTKNLVVESKKILINYDLQIENEIINDFEYYVEWS